MKKAVWRFLWALIFSLFPLSVALSEYEAGGPWEKIGVRAGGFDRAHGHAWDVVLGQQCPADRFGALDRLAVGRAFTELLYVWCRIVLWELLQFKPVVRRKQLPHAQAVQSPPLGHVYLPSPS